MFKSILSLIVILVFAACAAKKAIKPEIKEITYRELLQQNLKWQKSIKSLEADLRITLDTPQFSGNFNASILLTGNDSLLITVTGPLGIRLGKVFIANKRFIFYNQVMNQFMTGSKEDFKGTNFFQFPLDISQLRSVFIAQDYFDILEKKKFEIRDDYYYLEAANGRNNYNIWFDPISLLIHRIEYHEENRTLFFKEYNQFEKVSGIYFPKSVNFVRPEEKQGLALYFSELKINEPIDTKAYDVKISDSATQIDLSINNQTEFE